MARVNVSHRIVSYVYDFAVDGGAQGDLLSGVFLPVRCLIIYGCSKVITPLEAGAPTDVSVSISGFPYALIGPTAHTNWTGGAVIEGVDLIVDMFDTTVIAGELVTTIERDNLTAGKFIYWCHLIEIDR